MKNKISLYTVSIVSMLSILLYFLNNLSTIEPKIYTLLDVKVGAVIKFNVAHLTRQFLFIAGISSLLSLTLGLLTGLFYISNFGREF